MPANGTVSQSGICVPFVDMSILPLRGHWRFSGMMCSSFNAARNAALFAIIGSIVSSLTMPVVFTTAAISGAAISGATDFAPFRSAFG